jgi:hypothetical protein
LRTGVGTNSSLHLHLLADKVAIVELDCPLQLQFVLRVAVLLFPSVAVQVTVLVLSLNLLVNVLLFVQLSEALERLIENWREYKLPSLHPH